MTTSAVSTVIADAEGFFEAIGADVKTWAGDIETVVVDDAKVAWLALWPVLSSIGPAQWKIVQGLLATVNADIAEDDYGAIVNDVVAQAAAAELSWFVQLGTVVQTIIVTALRGSQLPAA